MLKNKETLGFKTNNSNISVLIILKFYFVNMYKIMKFLYTFEKLSLNMNKE